MKRAIIYILVGILVVTIGIFFYSQQSPDRNQSDKYFCNVDEDCAIRRINCDGCNFGFTCINKEWPHCELSPAPGEYCPPAPPWVTNCKCINSKCIDCRGDECKTNSGS